MAGGFSKAAVRQDDCRSSRPSVKGPGRFVALRDATDRSACAGPDMQSWASDAGVTLNSEVSLYVRKESV